MLTRDRSDHCAFHIDYIRSILGHQGSLFCGTTYRLGGGYHPVALSRGIAIAGLNIYYLSCPAYVPYPQPGRNSASDACRNQKLWLCPLNQFFGSVTAGNPPNTANGHKRILQFEKFNAIDPLWPHSS